MRFSERRRFGQEGDLDNEGECDTDRDSKSESESEKEGIPTNEGDFENNLEGDSIEDDIWAGKAILPMEVRGATKSRRVTAIHQMTARARLLNQIELTRRMQKRQEVEPIQENHRVSLSETIYRRFTE
jgi:hypothetical protein